VDDTFLLTRVAVDESAFTSIAPLLNPQAISRTPVDLSDRLIGQRPPASVTHQHTCFSTLDGMASASEVIEMAEREGVKLVAFSDHGNCLHAPSVFKAAKGKDVKVAPGNEFYVHLDERGTLGLKGLFHLTVFARNHQGYEALVKLTNRSEINRVPSRRTFPPNHPVSAEDYRPSCKNVGRPFITLYDLVNIANEFPDALVVGSGCVSSILNKILFRDFAHYIRSKTAVQEGDDCVSRSDQGISASDWESIYAGVESGNFEASPDFYRYYFFFLATFGKRFVVELMDHGFLVERSLGRFWLNLLKPDTHKEKLAEFLRVFPGGYDLSGIPYRIPDAEFARLLVAPDAVRGGEAFIPPGSINYILATGAETSPPIAIISSDAHWVYEHQTMAHDAMMLDVTSRRSGVYEQLQEWSRNNPGADGFPTPPIHSPRELRQSLKILVYSGVDYSSRSLANISSYFARWASVPEIAELINNTGNLADQFEKYDPYGAPPTIPDYIFNDREEEQPEVVIRYLQSLDSEVWFREMIAEFLLNSDKEFSDDLIDSVKRVFELMQSGQAVVPSDVPHFLLEAAYLVKVSRQGLEARLSEYSRFGKVFDRSDYEDRLITELKVIISRNFGGYFLLLADALQYVIGLGHIVGPGRGSAAGSLVAFVTGITQVDPIHGTLLFERFLNPERKSMPDIDTDLSAAARDAVLEYLGQKYGSIPGIATIGYCGIKQALGIARKAVGLSVAAVQRFTKQISIVRGKTAPAWEVRLALVVNYLASSGNEAQQSLFHGLRLVLSGCQLEIGSLNDVQEGTYDTATSKVLVSQAGYDRWIKALSRFFPDPSATTLPRLSGAGEVFIANDEAYAAYSEIVERIGPANARLWLDIGQAWEGRVKSIGVHACGYVLPTDTMVRLIPQILSSNGQFVWGFPMDVIEEMGGVKFDFLGLTSLDVIQVAVRSDPELFPELFVDGLDVLEISLRATNGVPLPPSANAVVIQAFEQLCGGSSQNVFQFRGAGAALLLDLIKPDSVEQLAMVSALNRPGPIDNGIHLQIAKILRGEEESPYQDELLRSILDNTKGLVYQEQILQIFRDLAGYSLGTADLVRRAIGKKKMKEMQFHRQIFVYGSEELNVPGCVANGYTPEFADELFTTIERFAEYCFNKSHSLAYALLGLVTKIITMRAPHVSIAAELRAHPDIDKVQYQLTLAPNLGVRISPPDIRNPGKDSFIALPTSSTGGVPTIAFGAQGLSGLGNAATLQLENWLANEQVTTGSKRMQFHRLCDEVGGQALTALIWAGAVDSLYRDYIEGHDPRLTPSTSMSAFRAQCRVDALAVKDSLKKAKNTVAKRMEAVGQISFFDSLDPERTETPVRGEIVPLIDPTEAYLQRVAVLRNGGLVPLDLDVVSNWGSTPFVADWNPLSVTVPLEKKAEAEAEAGNEEYREPTSKQERFEQDAALMKRGRIHYQILDGTQFSFIAIAGQGESRTTSNMTDYARFQFTDGVGTSRYVSLFDMSDSSLLWERNKEVFLAALPESRREAVASLPLLGAIGAGALDLLPLFVAGKPSGRINPQGIRDFNARVILPAIPVFVIEPVASNGYQVQPHEIPQSLIETLGSIAFYDKISKTNKRERKKREGWECLPETYPVCIAFKDASGELVSLKRHLIKGQQGNGGFEVQQTSSTVSWIYADRSAGYLSSIRTNRDLKHWNWSGYFDWIPLSKAIQP
jgi:DNA polymerase III alpha subunit